MKEIFSIFPKTRENKRIKIIEKPKIIADYRERNSLVISELIHLGMEIDFQQLKVADFIIRDVAIERKAVNDFVSSLINKRLFKQLEEIKQYPKYFLIIEGIEEQELYNDNPEGISGNAIRGFLLSIILNYKVPIIFTKDEKDTAMFINVLARKQAKKHFSINPKKKSFNKEEQKQFILEGFPGIGPATAKTLIKEFKSIKNITNTSIEKLQEVIGKKADIFKLVD